MATYPRPLLTEDDLAELTGYDNRQVKRQIGWLKSHGIAYTLRRDGRPRTTWGALENALEGETEDSQPNWDALERKLGASAQFAKAN